MVRTARFRSRSEVVEAAVLVTASKVALLVVPFPLLRRALGHRVDEPVRSEGPTPEAARRCARAIATASSRLPFDVACLPRAIAGQLMLRRRGLGGTVVFGLARQDGDLLNHAWLELGGDTVLGQDPGVTYTRMVAYGSPGRGQVRR